MKTIMFFNIKGGVGKTTSTVEIGCALGVLGLRVVALNLVTLGDLEMRHGFVSNIDIQPDADINVATLSQKIDCLEKLKYEVALLDCPTDTIAPNVKALSCADIVVVPVTPSGNAYTSTKKCIDMIEQEQMRRSQILPYKILFNFLQGNSQVCLAEYEFLSNLYKELVLHPSVPHERHFYYSENYRGSIVELAPQAKASRAYYQIAKKVLNIL